MENTNNELGFRLAHIGVNAADRAEAEKIAQLLCSVFDFEYKPGKSSVFSGAVMEVMSGNGRGTHGHIGIATVSCEKAEEYLKGKGIGFLEETRKVNPDGTTQAIYLDLEIGGFAVHIMRG